VLRLTACGNPLRRAGPRESSRRPHHLLFSQRPAAPRGTATKSRQKQSVMTRSHLDQFLTRVARAGFFALLSLGCLVSIALCSSLSTYAPFLKRADGSVVLDSSGRPIIVQNWRTDLVNYSPAIIGLTASAFFLILAVRAILRREPPGSGDTSAEQDVVLTTDPPRFQPAMTIQPPTPTSKDGPR